MNFNSIHYALFLPLVVLAFYSMPARFRWILLLCASYYFYMCWKLEYIFLIVVSTLVDYTCAIKIDKSPNQKEKKLFLTLSILCNLGILFAFKYFNFVAENLQQLFNTVNIGTQIPYFDVLLPVGISFYTFQSMSYTIDVYFGKLKPEKHFGYFALYVSFFPQLVAGPIERSTHFLPQLKKHIQFNPEMVITGLRLILWGFFKKVVIADRLAPYVNRVYDSPDKYEGFPVILAIYFFAIQIYCDFSGYTDIARGSARLLGIQLMKNFNLPYFSHSITNFWQRWHISLSTWFRDYVYIPLGGNRCSKARSYINIAIVFIVSGLWHGANWTFIVWGAMHGLMLSVEKALGIANLPSSKGIRVLKIFLISQIAVFSWIPFRANSLTDIPTIIFQASKISFPIQGINIALNPEEIILAFLFMTILLFVDFLCYLKPQAKISLKGLMGYTSLRWASYFLLATAVLFFGFHNQTEEFIYFQF